MFILDGLRRYLLKAPSANRERPACAVADAAEPVQLNSPSPRDNPGSNEEAHCIVVFGRIDVEQVVGATRRGKSLSSHVLSIVAIDPPAWRCHIVGSSVVIRVTGLGDEVCKKVMQSGTGQPIA